MKSFEITSIIDNIRIEYAPLIEEVKQLPARDFFQQVDWNERLVGILGARGVGKTTLLLQRLAGLQSESLYLSLDHPIATTLSLCDLARQFYLEGGQYLILDEVHKRPNWSIEVKSIFDTVPKLKVVFSGSSAVRIHAEKGDLSRRAALYHMSGLSLREYLRLDQQTSCKAYALEDIFKNHVEIAREITAQTRVVAAYKSYLQHGVYPFYREGLARFPDKLRNAVLYALETDLVQVHQLDPQYIPKLKKLLQMVAQSVPFSPNIAALAQAIEISRASVLRYLQILELGGILALLERPGRGYQKLSKPEKVYLDNTNLVFAFSGGAPDIGSMRETFCVNQLRAAGLEVATSPVGDFRVAGRYIFEVGGKKKSTRQIKSSEQGFVFRDDIEVGSGNVIPLWLLGFLY